MARLEDHIEILIQRRNPEGRIDHNAVRRVILQHIFDQAVNILDPRPVFDLGEIDPQFVELNFRFQKEDIPRLVRALRIPNLINTHSGHSATGTEAMCIFLRRLAYPNRLCDLQQFFGRSTAALSEIISYINIYLYTNFRHLLENLSNLPWLNEERLHRYSRAITAKGAAVQNCWGFIDGTARPICRPTVDQEDYYSGHKHFHCIKYQSVICPDGIIVSLIGAFAGRKHDAGIFRESGLYNQLEETARCPDGSVFVLFGDQAYGIRELLLCPYPGRGINEEQNNFNASMAPIRQAVEWGFQKVVAEFAFLDFKKNQKLLLQDIEELYITAAILINCFVCLYGSQTSDFFNLDPVNLEEYLNFN